MMDVDEKFFAWLDGELTGAEAAEMDARVAADPRLARIAEQHRALGARLRTAFDVVAEAPAPRRIVDAVAPQQAETVDLSARRESGRRLSHFGPVPQWAAMAATLLLGLGLGTLVAPGGGSSPVAVRDGKMFAAAALDEALDSQLASAGAAEGVRIGITFRDQTGAICRTFSDAQSSGLACRDRAEWRIRGLFAAPQAQATDYRMASSVDQQLADLVDSAMAGEAFDAQQEEAARLAGWR